MVHIKTELFEGPLELLLDLIETQKLSINQVSLAAIADDYIAEVKTRASVAPAEVAHFLVVASTLMLIKSRSLLPHLPVSSEEKQSMQNLEERLLRLRRMRDLSKNIANRAHSGVRMYARSAVPELPAIFYPPENTTPALLNSLIKAALTALPQLRERSRLPELALTSVISLEEKIIELSRRVETSLANSFHSYIGATKEKTEIIVSFLALLELVKQGRIVVEQARQFGDIALSKNLPTT
jgi:segregation and condensation protein A